MDTLEETSIHTRAPVDPQRRIEAVDMVRGFALFGVLLVNMFNFGAYSIVWTEPEDELAFSAMRFFFETKSWRLFALLFGFGFALQLIRAEDRGLEFAPVYLRRLSVLFAIGAAHATIYRGDILMQYAELGLLLVLFRNVPPKRLLVLSFCLLAVFPVGRAVSSLLEPTPVFEVTEYSVRIEAEMAEMQEGRLTHPHAVGSVRDVMAHNAHLKNPFSKPLGPESSLAVFAMFLLGLFVGRQRIFQNLEKHMQLVRRVFWWGLPIGLVSMTVERILSASLGYAVFRDSQAKLLTQFLGDVLFVYGSTALALAYAAGITLLAQRARGKRFLAPLGAAGRMALTVYVLGSVLFGVLFYGFAFGNVFRLGPAAVSGYAVLFFTVLVLLAVWWTNRFRFGPLEWLWRALTYWKSPSMSLQDRLHVES